MTKYTPQAVGKLIKSLRVTGFGWCKCCHRHDQLANVEIVFVDELKSESGQYRLDLMTIEEDGCHFGLVKSVRAGISSMDIVFAFDELGSDNKMSDVLLRKLMDQ